jgi:DNA-binding transcriptional regulator YiaG
MAIKRQCANAFKSEALAALHECMFNLYQTGAIDNKTMREFDQACLAQPNSAAANYSTARKPN